MRKYYCTFILFFVLICFAFSQKEENSPYSVEQRAATQEEQKLQDKKGQKIETDGKPPSKSSEDENNDEAEITTLQNLENRIDRAERAGGIGLLGLIIWTLLVGFIVYRILQSKKQKLLDELVIELQSSPVFNNAVQQQINAALNTGNKSAAKNRNENTNINERFRKEESNRVEPPRVRANAKPDSPTKREAKTEVFVPAPPPHSANESVDFVMTKYYSPPSVSGVFQGDYIENIFRRGESIFKLITEDEEQGKFTLIDKQEVVQQVSKSPSLYLNDACTIEGSGSFDTQKEIKIKPGKIIKQGKNWKITQKAVIQLT